MEKRGVWELGVVVSALLRELKAEEEGFDEARTYGAMPDVCGLIMNGTDRNLARIFTESGWTPEEVAEAVAVRTNDKVVFNLGLSMIQDRMEVMPRG